MKDWFKRLWSCRVRGVHSFGRAQERVLAYKLNGVTEKDYVKQCRHCGSVRAVRRRSTKKGVE